MAGLAVAVLGGSGFLGRQVVEQLVQEREDASCPIRQVKVLDIEPYHGTSDVATYEACDVRDAGDVARCLAGVDAVVNCAAVTPDLSSDDLGYSENMWAVNVDGVKTLVDTCKEAGVRLLVHTSSVAVILGGQKLMEHTESLTPHVPDKELLLGEYARGRRMAEKLVLEANGSVNSSGVVLFTVALRPPLMYGEGDQGFVPLLLRLARDGGGALPSVGNPEALIQAAYVGNVAWGHVAALRTLVRESQESSSPRGRVMDVSGLPVYLTDDTPPDHLPGLTYQLVNHLGVQPSRCLSYWLVSLLLLLSGLWLALSSLVGRSSRLPFVQLPPRTLHSLASTMSVTSRMRAELCLGYSPKYSWLQARDRSRAFYGATPPVPPQVT